MPWVVKQNDGKYCVYKKGEDTPIKGGCHAARKDAVNHMRALYANVKEFSENVVESRLTMLRPLRFSEEELQGEKLVKWVQALPYGSWDHPIYGMTHFNRWNAETMVKNFNEGVHGKEHLATDYEHGLDPAKGTKASGTILKMEARDDGLWQYIEFTPQASKEIKDGEWLYYSADYNDVWENPMDNTIHSDVVQGGALTNRPWVRGMMPLNFSEVLVERGVLNKNETTGEVAWEEHHDPDQDPHQKPKPEDPDTAADTGSRVPTPPLPDDQEQEASVEVTAGMLTALGLPEDATAEQVEEAVTNMATEIAPLREAAAKSEEQKQFSERFPEQHAKLTEAEAELARLRKKDAERDAEAFGKRFSEFTIKVPGQNDEGEDVEVEVRKGFSALVCDGLTELHKKFSEGTATADDLTPILEKIVSGDGIVEYGERGTSQGSDDESQAANPQEAARKLSELAWAAVHESEKGDSPITYGDALSSVMKANPDLTALYTGKEG